MRVLFIDNAIGSLNNLGGAGQCLVELLAGLESRGIATAVCGIGPSNRLLEYAKYSGHTYTRVSRPDSVAVYRSIMNRRGGGAIAKFLLSRALPKALRAFQPHVVHVNLLRKWDIFDLSISRRHGAMTVGHVRSLGSQAGLAVRDLQACDTVLGVSDAVIRDIRTVWHQAPATRLYDAVNFGSYRTDQSQADCRRVIGMGDVQGPIAISVGALEPRKGHETAIRSVAEMQRRGKGVTLAIAGAAYDVSSNAESLRLSALAMDLGISESVQFLGKVSNMAAAYAAADFVLALSSDGEAFGRVPVEAAAAGRPVIATRAGATPEIVEDSVSGFLVSPLDAIAVADAVISLSENHSLRASIVNEAHKLACRRFNIADQVPALERVYLDLLRQGPARRTS